MRNLCDHSQMMSVSSLRSLKVREVTARALCVPPGITFHGKGAGETPGGRGRGCLGHQRHKPSTSCFLCSSGDIKQEGMGAFREGPPYQRRGALQLWQFLVALLDDPTNAHFIAWTGRVI